MARAIGSVPDQLNSRFFQCNKLDKNHTYILKVLEEWKNLLDLLKK
jgi:hypothetical protein